MLAAQNSPLTFAMDIAYGLLQSINERPTILTIGAFDGVHHGHQHLIGATVRRARELDCQSAVLTFDPHPDTVIHPERSRLPDESRRADRSDRGLGADLLIVLPFTREVMGLPAREFMDQIRSRSSPARAVGRMGICTWPAARGHAVAPARDRARARLQRAPGRRAGIWRGQAGELDTHPRYLA